MRASVATASFSPLLLSATPAISMVFTEKTADISLWFPREMTFEKRARKFYNDDAYKPDLDRASDWSEIFFIQSEALRRSGY